MEADCCHPLVALVWAVFCAEKQQKENKTVLKLMAEKRESAWFLHFITQANTQPVGEVPG